MRYDDSCKLNDLQVREKLEQPSVDCILMRRRLLYLGRLLVHKPAPLLAMLASTRDGMTMPWAKQIAEESANKKSGRRHRGGKRPPPWKK